MASSPAAKTKHAQIIAHLREGILDGTWRLGERIPSEPELAARFRVTRVTVGRALRELEFQGLLDRRRGSGSYVRAPDRQKMQTFALLVPSLGEGEIFEPICHALATTIADRNHRLLWGQFSSPDREERSNQAKRLCRSYIDQRVDGVFFAPVELTSDMHDANALITGLLERAGIPLVLLDRDVATFPGRSRYDVIGIDNRRAGYVLASHFLALGCRRIAFVCRPLSAQTVDARIAGYRDALLDHGIAFSSDWIHRVDLGDPDAAAALFARQPPHAVVCANDSTAAQLIPILLRRGWRVPEDIRIAGIDDLKYAGLLAVSLTTIRQPCVAMGKAAANAMLERVGDPGLAGRDIQLDFELVVRDSSRLAHGTRAARRR